MYAIIDDAGVQYKVTEGQTLEVDLKKSLDDGANLTFDRVLLVVDGDDIRVGAPAVDGASVSATVVEKTKGKKIDVSTFKRRKDSHRHIGHRQPYTKIKIDKIQL